LFRQSNVEKSKLHPLSVLEWFNKCSEDKFKGPGPKDSERSMVNAVDARAKREEARKRREEQGSARSRRGRKSAQHQAREVDEITEEDGQKEVTAGETLLPGTASHNYVTPRTDNSQPDEKGKVEGQSDIAKSQKEASQPLPSGSSSSPSNFASSHTPAHDPEPMEPELEATEEELKAAMDWYERFDPKHSWLPPNTAPIDYTPEACATMERKFWKVMGLGEPAWYGADLQGETYEVVGDSY
jgi:hypothetical protein